MARRTIALLVAVAVAGPAAAEAGRLPYKSERIDIANSLDSTPRCLSARISVVNERWAAVRSTNRVNCLQADGVLVMKRVTAHRWRIRYQGPNDPTSPCRYINQVPAAVGKDLHVCGRN